MIVAHIDRDYLFLTDDTGINRGGTEWSEQELKDYYTWQNMGEQMDTSQLAGLERTRFRMLDDDREVYYGGWLLNDDECMIQMMVSAWGTNDAGAIHIEIRKDGEWVMEIA